MKKFWTRFGPADFIGLVLIVGILIRDGANLDTSYPIIIASIVAFYFGHVSGTRQKADITEEIAHPQIP